jgi:GH43 family beta-xylosidase
VERAHRRSLTVRLRVLVVLVAACGGSSPGGGGTGDDAHAIDAPPEPCATRIEYGMRWIKPATHDATFDLVNSDVTWDGTCTTDGANSYATLSNGFKPYFTGEESCAIALDHTGGCTDVPTSCTTRITYGSAWIAAPNHPATYDDVEGRVFWNGTCTAAGADSRTELSNGWQPYFTGASSCGISQRWSECGGLYRNPVMDVGCADPGVAFDGTRYIMSCTSGNAADAFPLWVSTDLLTWQRMGHILPAAARPAWAKSDFWAPELHKIGTKWFAYWSARQANGMLAIGAASADDVLGPYTALPAPIIANAGVGLIDASALVTPQAAYLVWKEDGNAQGAPTPIKMRELAGNGLAFASATTTTLITNDKTWEGNLVEGPFVIEHDGSYYLFYSGNAYYDSRYAIGVARASAPMGPYTKAAAPIVTTSGAWIGPGHNSIVTGPGGDTYAVYHAWKAGQVNGPGDRRYPLVDQVQWDNGWPVVYGAPSTQPRPHP